VEATVRSQGFSLVLLMNTHTGSSHLSACLLALVVQGSVAPGGSYVNKLFYGSL